MIGPVLLALAPTLLLMALGRTLAAGGFLADAFWPQAERLAYFVLLPALFFVGLATADIGDLPVAALAATLMGATLGVAAMTVATRGLFGLHGPAFTSVFQGAVRFNNYVGVTVAAGLFGAKGVALAALCNAALAPLARLVGLDGPALTTALVFASPPTASSAYILARQLGGDAPLMAGVTAAQTALGFVLTPLATALLTR